MTESSASLYAVRNPATGELVESFPTATDAEVAAAVDAAAAAHASWGRASAVADRAALLHRVADLHRERSAELSAAMVEEMGKPLGDAEGEVDFSADIYDYYADNAERFLADEPIDLGGGSAGSAVIRRGSVGVLLGIMPWNFPAYQVARFVAPNLATGNTIVLKHAPQCPRSAALLQQLFLDAGFPEGAYVNVYATNEQIADVIADPRVQGVSLTGSERAGAAVAEIAGRNLKKVVLELGGSDPFIVLGSDDLDATVEAAVGARMENTGQACNAGKRFIIVDELHDDFVSRFTDALLAATPGSPLSSLAAAENLARQVEEAVAGGASLASAGERDGAFHPSGVLSGMTTDNPAYRQELFGPVAMVLRAADEDDAIRIANDTPYGLGSYVFTPDAAQAQRVADQIDAGMVFVNGVGLDAAELPFGGVKRSGFGRELGRYGMEEFVNKKLIRTV
ncbi:NAD-dependent succinate-semialdehyde dehydrogenase [Nocardioides caeni]|uniref:NAD-dependent succinate-semialdehyde dehydrogenase n=1 Tax=Nocardioides caeni TaxID=574700 RepID=A0A4S8N5V1_9ACTN|nr:NAD-dependent succinate-semialdehyde dehydrogenase [Nocardioides caeni]THV10104.1 NAD-dependent succinate-semialdehyde dehydrogenase [Nocardioides caeni]